MSAAENPGQKPQVPVQVSILPLHNGPAAKPIEPGDVIDFKVVAVSMVSTPEMKIQVKLVDGASLVSGRTSWTGPVQRNERKELLFSVRVPKAGAGKVRAKVIVTGPDTRTLVRKEQYIITTARQHLERSQKNGQSAHPVKKDGKGRAVSEY